MTTDTQSLSSLEHKAVPLGLTMGVSSKLSHRCNDSENCNYLPLEVDQKDTYLRMPHFLLPNSDRLKYGLFLLLGVREDAGMTGFGDEPT